MIHESEIMDHALITVNFARCAAQFLMVLGIDHDDGTNSGWFQKRRWSDYAEERPVDLK